MSYIYAKIIYRVYGSARLTTSHLGNLPRRTIKLINQLQLIPDALHLPSHFREYLYGRPLHSGALNLVRRSECAPGTRHRCMSHSIPVKANYCTLTKVTITKGYSIKVAGK